MKKEIIEKLREEYPDRKFEFVEKEGIVGIVVDGEKTLKCKFNLKARKELLKLHGIDITEELLFAIVKEVKKELDE